MRKKLALFALFLGLIIPGCGSRNPEVTPIIRVTTTDNDYKIVCRPPVRWEDRLDRWNQWLLPPEDQRFVWIYCHTTSLSPEPRRLRRRDIQISYTLGETGRYTTTLIAKGNNDIYMWAPNWDSLNGGIRNYGGVTSENGFGTRYVFAVPPDAREFVLEITGMPPLELSD